jgi:small nuclear ribonucleoprotein (snRNP)-like protein
MKFDQTLREHIGDRLTVYLSDNRAVQGKLVSCDNETGLILEESNCTTYLNPESVVICGFSVNKRRKRGSRKGKVKGKVKRGIKGMSKCQTCK